MGGGDEQQLEQLVLGVWCLVFGAWCLVLVRGTWCLVLGTWYLVLGAWCLVLGAWCLVLGVWCWYEVPGGGWYVTGLPNSRFHLLTDTAYANSIKNHLFYS
ncbi:hypothetical protein [Paenibacillus qinlingensis]|uniref:hypothetical protein n=1 Tax=Paenibacillus qinlingensis TaxID=1837343 RepID=UPI001565D8B0|nr:hypothetical protein [Paenibacillus qinlingensis]NQX57742.1 hypothetical protein [Paenibacillus qinlingensis]